MLLVLPTTSAIHPTSPQLFGYYPGRSYRPQYDALSLTVPSYPSNLDFFRQPSPAELEEREYQRALEVVVNHRRRQAEKEATIRRRQLAEAARRQYLVALAAEFEQRQEEELLAARRAEFISSQQAQADQHALDLFLRQLKGPRQITRQPHVTKSKPLADRLKQRLAGESDADIVKLIGNILSSLESPPADPVESVKPKPSSEGASEVIETVLSSIFPGLVFRTQPEPTPSTEQTQQGLSDKGKGKAPAVDVEEPQQPAQKPQSTDDAFADILRHVMEFSKSTNTPRSPDEAGPSGSSSSPSSVKPAVNATEQAQIDRAVALSSVEHVHNALTELQSTFVLPTELDHYTTSTDDRDDTASVSSVSSSDLTRLIPYTSANKSVYKYENELNGLLEELDRIDSHGDVEVREKRKEVVKAIEKALEDVERVVGGVVEKRHSVVSNAISPADEPLKGFEVDEDTTETAPAEKEAETPVLTEETVIIPVDVPTPADEALPETYASTVTETVPDLPVEQAFPESDVEASTATVTPESVESKSVAETESRERQVQVDAPENVDTFLLPEQISPPSPVQRPRQIDIDSDEEVLVLDSDAKSEWSELEQ